jgi:hypothetical protein
MLVSVCNCISHVSEDSDCFGDRQFPLSHQFLAQTGALDIWHHVIEEAVDLSRVVEGQDMGMLEVGSDGDLAEESLGTKRSREIGSQDLHRHLAVVARIFREVDRCHPARAELALDAVTISEGLGKALQKFCHGNWAKVPSGRTLVQFRACFIPMVGRSVHLRFRVGISESNCRRELLREEFGRVWPEEAAKGRIRTQS